MSVRIHMAANALGHSVRERIARAAHGGSDTPSSDQAAKVGEAPDSEASPSARPQSEKPAKREQKNGEGSSHDLFRRFAHRVSCAVGTPTAFFVALFVLVAWAVSGPVFGFSDTWQLIINTGTTIVTFLMVFLIQSTQNRDASAIHLKLDELIRASKYARDDLLALEQMTDAELEALEGEFEKMSHKARDIRGSKRNESERPT